MSSEPDQGGHKDEDVVFSSRYRIEPIGGGEPEPLWVRILRPQPEGDGVTVRFRICCRHFDDRLSQSGRDGPEAVSRGLHYALEHLKRRAAEGYRIYAHDPGDLEIFDFWSYGRKPPKFPPISAYAKSEQARRAAGGGDLVQPSHRVAVREADLSATVYRVSPDGSDRPWRTLDPEELRERGLDDAAATLGEWILSDSPAGRRILGRDPGD